MVDFISRHISRDKKDNCPYARPRKQYTRTHPPVSGFFKFNPLPREKAAIIKLTNLGYPINQLSKVFGRSTSFIHKTVRTAITRKIAHFIDKRKLPAKTRLACSTKRWINLQKWIEIWMPFIMGEVDRPP
jgi:hypothetical protein